MIEPGSAEPSPGTVSLADEEGVKQVLVGTMWSELVQWARAHMLDPRLPVVNVEDLSIPRCVATADEAIAVIPEHHSRWRRG